MTSIILSTITGLNYPYNIYVCDVYGNNCAYISQINAPVPSPVEIVLPPPFDNSSSVGIKIITDFKPNTLQWTYRPVVYEAVKILSII